MIGRTAPSTLLLALFRGIGGFRDWQVWRLRPALRTYIFIVTCAAAALTLFAVIRAPVGVRDIATYLSLLGCGVIAIESTRTIKERKGTAGRDMQSVWYLAIAITLPPAYAFFAPIPLMAYHLWRVRRVFAYRRIFSNAAISLAYGAGSWAFHLIPASAAGAEPGSGLHVVSWTGLVAATGAVAWAINVAFVIIAIKLSDQKVRVRDLVGNRETASSDLIELSLAVSLSLVVAINPVLMVLAVPSVVLYRRYLMNAQFVAQARMDGKTGVLNADSWRHEADVEVFRAQRTHTPLALVMVGIDHFSSVTDTAGHDGADQVLRGIANVLTQNLQGAGIIGRVGTQEFAMLLPQAGQSEARRLAERVRDHIAGEPIAIEDGAHAGFVFRLTVSIGIAVLDHSKRALAELIGAADTALTVAKTTGRNRVCIVPDGSSQVL